ncbi:hypothetical protein DPMN_050334 [Dreissena polymorpha]|uniref:Uncharacterized protein n=1 Tax=Dreissena polymorpha TaxID=45954 RepID=A0A9D4CFX4_DREPO|nr:hypothetical protein DPMN_050334 [Dreissena polymorpha]
MIQKSLSNQVFCALLRVIHPLIYIVHPAFRLTAPTSTSLKRTLENSLAQSSMHGYVFIQSKLSSFDGRRKGLLWTKK